MTPPPSSTPDLLAFLRQRGGQEYRVTAVLRSGKGRKAVRRELGEYRLTARGEEVQATGPSGQPRMLSEEDFLNLFGGHEFTPAEPTGVLTDLGPLFS